MVRPLLQDLDEVLHATEWLVEGRLGYRESLENYYERFLRFNGGDKSIYCLSSPENQTSALGGICSVGE